MHILIEIWKVLMMMAPYLLFGFAVAGGLSLVLTRAWVVRHLGGRGLAQVVKAALLGVPLPLCSCGVLPLSFSLRNEGASKGATVSFLAATPQTGIDSIMLTYSLLGPILTAVRVAAAFFSGVLAGTLTDLFDREVPRHSDECDKRTGDGNCCCGAPAAVTPTTRPSEVRDAPPPWLRALRHGFVTLPQGMAKRLLFGVLIAGLVAAFTPEGFLAKHLSSGMASYLLAFSIGIPMYVCSAASVPIAATLVHMGVSPGAAMVFLIAGPGVNAASITSLWRQIGGAGTMALLTSLGAISILCGTLLDRASDKVLASMPVVQAACEHGGHGASPLEIIATVVLLALLLPGLWRRRT